MPSVASQIEGLVRDVARDVRAQARSDVADVADACAKALRKSSPKSAARGRHYRSGWTSDLGEEGWASVATVFNRRKPGLTHLLEHGHGGPHPAPAHPHIEAAASAAISDLARRTGG